MAYVKSFTMKKGRNGRATREATKIIDYAVAYGLSAKHFAEALAREPMTEEIARDFVRKQPHYWQEVQEIMAHQWLIDGEWSAYHNMMANKGGWGLSQKQGMWQIVTVNDDKFKTDDEARAFVLFKEFDTDNLLYGIAINAIVVGNIRG